MSSKSQKVTVSPAESAAPAPAVSIQTGLTGVTILLPTEDAELYAKHVESYRSHYLPVGYAELEVVQRMADNSWRLSRIPTLEAGIFALGRAKLADAHANQPAAQVRAMMIQAEVVLAYDKPLRNLRAQDSHLRRNLEQDKAAIKELQEKRKQDRAKRFKQAVEAYTDWAADGCEFELEAFGTDLSIAEVDACARELYTEVDFAAAIATTRKAA